MKYKKYSYVLLILILLVGINPVNAKELDYLENDYVNIEKNTMNIKEEQKVNVIQINKSRSSSSECESLFGSKSDPNSIRYLLNEILMYPKIIVPILVILLGTLDFGKAVISSKEDEMKKAQNTFVKRLLLGIVIFFVPTIIDIIMYLAEFVWSSFGLDTSCRL